ncbi:MAG: AzlD domain-containing protein [Ruminococcaceae bacterium]|nr:AzlD domain-containing protein [Oscillospiraceae bacterium]
MFFLYVLVMAIVTYLIRMLPFTLVRKKITNIYVKSFLHYVPYAVLGAMTFPVAFYSTGNIYTAMAGLVVALILAFLNRSLLTVAVASCVTAYVCGLLI